MADYQSRFGANLNNLAVGEGLPDDRPTCNPCRQGDHGRCPTVLADNDIIDSTFDCKCHAQDPEMHETSFEINQEEFVRDEYLREWSHFRPWDD